MSTEPLLKLVTVIIIAIVFFIINSKKSMRISNISLPNSIRDIATKDLQYVGCYSERLYVSLCIWIYHVVVLCNTQYGWVDIRKLLREWEGVIYDPDGIIMKAITNSLTKYDNIVRDAKRSDTEPMFKIAVAYDYHVLPKTMRCNDYCKIDWLINYLDEEIGGN